MSQKDIEQLKNDNKFIIERLKSVEGSNDELKKLINDILENVKTIDAKIDFMGLSLADIEKTVPAKVQKRTNTKGRKPTIDEGTDDNRPEIKTPSVVDIRTPTTTAIITPGPLQNDVSENDEYSSEHNGTNNNDNKIIIGFDDDDVAQSQTDKNLKTEVKINQPMALPLITKPVVFPILNTPKKKYNKLTQFHKIFKHDDEFIYKFLPVGTKSELDKDKSFENLQGDKLTRARSSVFYNWMVANPTKIGNFFDELSKK